MSNTYENQENDYKILFIGDIDENVILSNKNIPTTRTSYVKVVENDGEKQVFSNISVYDILKYDTVITTKAAVEFLEEVYA